jgi:hypothetical protein
MVYGVNTFMPKEIHTAKPKLTTYTFDEDEIFIQ